MANGSDGLPDSGTATLTVAGLTKNYTWCASDSSLNIANNLARQLRADPTRQADYTSVTSCGQNCSQINLQALSAGPDPSYNGGISHSDPSGYFPSSSFNSSPTGATAMTGGAAGSPSLYSYALSFAGDGSITGGNDSANGNWTYGYDEFNRLKSSNKNSGAQTFTYAYDRLGNRWQQTAPQGGPAPQYNFDSNNHISGSGITYDALGNIVTDGLGNSYTWDAENRLASINGGARSYIYDPLGRRVAEKQNGTLIAEFLYDLHGNKLSSFDGSGNAVAEEIYAGGRHLATYLNSTNSTYFHHTDWLGTLRTDSGVNGASTQTCTGLPFGDGASCTGTFSSANLFTDDFHDAEDNLEDTLFRKLSTTQGRWMSPDPSGMAAVSLTNPQSLNMYAYVGNNPIKRLDPLGLKCDTADRQGADSEGCGTVFTQASSGLWNWMMAGIAPNPGSTTFTMDGLDTTPGLALGALSSGAGTIGPTVPIGLVQVKDLSDGTIMNMPYFYTASADGSQGWVDGISMSEGMSFADVQNSLSDGIPMDGFMDGSANGKSDRLERLKNCALGYYGFDPLSLAGLAGASKWGIIAAGAGGIPKAIPEALGLVRTIRPPGSSSFTSIFSIVSAASGGGGMLRSVANFGSKWAGPIAIASALIDATAIGICTASD